MIARARRWWWWRNYVRRTANTAEVQRLRAQSLVLVDRAHITVRDEATWAALCSIPGVVVISSRIRHER